MIVTNDKRREVAAKVRDVMGELATIELDGIPLADLIEPTECDECSTPNRFEELTAEIHEAYENLADAMDCRLMPEGMEWPRFEDGEPVSFGSLFENADGEPEEADVVSFTAEGARLKSLYGTEYGTFYRYGERVKRPPVLAADGEPLEVGQTVWETDVESDTPMTVVEVSSDLIWCEYTWKDGKTYRPCCPPSTLTHTKPVLDADGVPIKKGDTVYGTVDGGPFVVTEVSDKGGVLVDAFPDMEMHGSMFTHTKPEIDSWELLEDDATKPPCAYCVEHGLDDDSLPTNEKFACDLVRRARMLAGDA